ncbi:hypothetical protein B4119_2590 [Parageobacillus caldoxylosilyticus]|uniref:Uncharacterized protein n=1 Tax=Saccharococcus caldoxylosilyticus TaxID=81408 RepID=A0A150LD93_9BACL|nr:hypothetical protein B4119_2590 [Parageobacillus caldoxylosilyticus]
MYSGGKIRTREKLVHDCHEKAGFFVERANIHNVHIILTAKGIDNERKKG